MSDVRIYRYSTVAKAIFVLSDVAVLFLSLYSWTQGRVGHVYVGGMLIALLTVLAVKVIRQEFKLGRASVEVHRLLSDKSIRYEDIAQIRMGDSIDAVQVYASASWWPDVSVHYGIHDWKGLTIGLVERVPPEVEVVDPWGITADVQQGAKWSGASAQAT